MGTTCNSLLSELQKIWDEVGEVDNERDRMLYELEQECLDAYRRKVDQASQSRAQLQKRMADSEAQLADICAALGERPAHIKKVSGGLKKELRAILPHLEEMKKKMNERKNQFVEVLQQINIISKELEGSVDDSYNPIVIDVKDLSLKILDDLRNKLILLQKTKSERLKQVLDQLSVVKGLCMVLGMDFRSIIRDVNPTLDESSGKKSISTNTIQRLSATISRLTDVKMQRMQRRQELAITMVELWNLMDTPAGEQQLFQNVTRTIAASESEITEPDSLSLMFIDSAEAEVMRLQDMKLSKIKEVLLKKSLVLEEMCQGANMVVEGQFSKDRCLEAIESGAIDPNYLLQQMELQISKVKEEAFSRKELLEKIQKWLSACEEESWLEEYNRDENRYNAGRGTHLMLKRAERARVVVNKIPAMVELLKSKAKAWKNERGVDFFYDGVDLLSMIEQYSDLNQLREEERQRQKDQKKLQGQLLTEKEAIYGSKPSPSKIGNRSSYKTSMGGVANKRFSLGGALLQNSIAEKGCVSSSNFLKKSNLKKTTPYSHKKSNLTAHASGKKLISGSSNKQHPFDSSQNNEILPQRKPLSPLSSLSSNIVSGMKSGDFQGTHVVSKTPLTTPTKNVNASVYDENKTPKTMPIPLPSTPPTVSNVMQTAMTPFTPGGVRVSEEVDYSYEERRAGFLCS